MAKEIHKVPVSITRAQFRTLTKGGKIRLKASQLKGDGPHVLHLTSKAQVNKLAKAAAKNKGCEIALSPDEFRHTMEGEGFKDFMRKTGRWLKKAAKSVWSGFKDATNVAKHAAYALTDGVAEAIPAAAPVLAQGAMDYYMPQNALMRGMDYYMPQNALMRGVSDFSLGPPPQKRRQAGWGVTNPADNLENHVDTKLFGIHNHTPDHVLMNNNSNFIPGAHPASTPTLTRWDPLARMALGSTVGGAGVGSPDAVHPAMTPVFRERENIRNTPAAITRGGSFLPAGR